MINIKSLLQCFLKHPELIDKDLDKILNIESYLRQFPEVGFFSYILCDFYASAYLYAKKSTNIEIKAALDWYCDCIINTKDCSSLAVLRFFLLNPELAQDLLYLTQSEEDHGFYPWMN